MTFGGCGESRPHEKSTCDGEPDAAGTADAAQAKLGLLCFVIAAASIFALPGAGPAAGSTSGLVAAYAFDEGAGSVLTDASGNGHDGTISGATWAGGHDGGALSFNGSSASVDLGALGTFYQSGFTLEAWLQKATTKKDVGVLGTWTRSGGPMIWIDHIVGDYQLTLGASASSTTSTPATLPASGSGSTWPRPSTAARPGSTSTAPRSRAAASRTASVLPTPGGSEPTAHPAGNFFDGLIDNVRIYNRALGASEIQTDMGQPVTSSSDTSPPSSPGTLTASGAVGQVGLSWGPANDNVGVVRYDVYRGTSTGFAPTVANRIAQPSGTSYTDGSLEPGTYYYKVAAEDAAGNLGPPSNEASGTSSVDTTPPTSPNNVSASPSGNTVTLNWSASTDDVGVVRYDVYRGTSAGFAPTSANRIGQPSGTSFADAGLAAGTYYYKVAAEDAAGNASAPSSDATAIIADTTPPPLPRA